MARIGLFLLMVTLMATPHMVYAQALKAIPLKTPDGHEFVYVPMPGRSLSSIAFLWRGGFGFLPPGQEFIKVLGPALMTGGGTRSITAAELDERMKDLNAYANFKAHSDTHTSLLTAPKDDLETAARLLNSMLREPALEERWLKRFQRRVPVQMKRRSSQPAAQAHRAFELFTMGDHSWFRAETPLPPERIMAFTADDIRRWHMTAISADDVIIAAAGSSKASQVARAIDMVLAGLPQLHGRRNAAPPTLRHRPRTILIHRPQLKKSVLLIGGMVNHQGETAKEELRLATNILGLGDRSRLHVALRRDLRATYDYTARLSGFTDRKTELVMAGEIETGKLRLALKLINQTYETLRRDGVDQENFDAYRRFELYNVGNGFNRPSNIAQRLILGMFIGQRPARILAAPDRISALTRDGVNAAIRKHFPRFDQLTKIIVTPDRNAVEADCIITDFRQALTCR